MCGGGTIGKLFKQSSKLDPFDLTGRRSARAEKAAKAAVDAEAARIEQEKELKRKQRKATAIIYTSGQGLGAEGGALGQ